MPYATPKIYNTPQGCWSEDGVSGRRSAIVYTCKRCGEIEVVLETIEMRHESSGNLQCYEPPNGWNDTGVGLLCPKCCDALSTFMTNGKISGRPE